MNILLISDSYPPEIRSASRLMHEFATGMVQHGLSVNVLTTVPQYNLVEGGSNNFATVEVEDGVRVVRINTLPIHLIGMIKRGIGILSLPYFFIRAGKKYILDDIDIIFVYSPPLTLAIAGSLLSKYYKAKHILNIQDLFPQNAIDLGLMKNSLLIAFFELIEKYAYKSADFITVHSHGNYQILLEQKNVNPEKLGIFHNWVETNNVSKKNKTQINFREKYTLEDNFVILFGGIMGPAQGLEVVISAAEFLQQTNACFLLVGNGTEKAHLQRLAAEKKLDNVVFKPFVPLDKYEALLECADVGLVSLSKKMKTPVVPGKLVSYMTKNIPVAASLNRESDGRQIVKDAKCGYVSDAGDGEALAKNILKLMKSSEMALQMGKSGRQYVEQYMSKEMLLKCYIDLFHTMLSNIDPSENKKFREKRSIIYGG